MNLVLKKDLMEKIINLIFPPVCGFCNKINENFLCEKCKEKFKYIKISQIDDYSKQPVYFDEHYYMFKYEKDVRDNILKYKFGEKSYMYKSYSRLIFYDDVFKNQFIGKYDYIISVPLHKKRLRKRGYNQSKLIARDIMKLFNKEGNINNSTIKYLDNVIIKNKNIVAQSSLNDKLERIKNAKNAFDIGLNIAKVKDKKIAIFDDIFTTGATVNECAKILKKFGVKYVGIFTIAKA